MNIGLAEFLDDSLSSRTDYNSIPWRSFLVLRFLFRCCEVDKSRPTDEIKLMLKILISNFNKKGLHKMQQQNEVQTTLLSLLYCISWESFSTSYDYII